MEPIAALPYRLHIVHGCRMLRWMVHPGLAGPGSARLIVNDCDCDGCHGEFASTELHTAEPISTCGDYGLQARVG